MATETWIALGILALIVGLATGYVIKTKKSGKKCIGCTCSCCNGCQKSE